MTSVEGRITMKCPYRLPVVLLCLIVGCNKVGTLIESPELAGTYSSDGGSTNLTIERLDGSSYAVTLPDGRTATCTLSDNLLEGKVGGETVWVKTAGSKITVNAFRKQTEFSKITNDIRPIAVAKSPGPTKVAEPAPPPVTPASPPPAEEKPKPVQVRQVRFTLAEDGDCQLVLDTKTEGSPAEEPSGEPVALAGVNNGVVRKTEAGTHRIVYSFGEVGSTADFARLNGTVPQPLDGVSIDRTAGTLVMTPVVSDAKSQYKKAKFSYPRLVRPPVSVVVDFDKLTNGTFVIQLESQTPTGVLGINVAPDESHKDVKAEVFWIPVVAGKRGKTVGFLDRKFEPEKVSESAFHLPTDPGTVQDRYSLAFGLHGREPVAIRRLDVDAKVMPSFGMAWDLDKGKPKIKTVMKGGPSERAGLQGGDVLVSLDGEKPSDLKDLMARLSQAPIGADVKFVVLRAGKEKAIAVKGE